MRKFLIAAFGGTILISIPTFAMELDEKRGDPCNIPVKHELTEKEEELQRYMDNCDRDPEIDLRNFTQNNYEIPSKRLGKDIAFLSNKRALGMMQEPNRPRKINGQWWSLSKEEHYTHFEPASILYAAFYPDPSKLYFSNLLTKTEFYHQLAVESPAIQRIFVLEKVEGMTDDLPFSM